VPPSAPNLTPYLTLGGIVCLGLIILAVVVPLLTRLSIWAEALTLAGEGLGEYLGHPRLVWLACLVVVLMICGCVVLVIVVAGALLTCNPGNTAQLCRLIGR
jgi:hypothetical protein